LSAYDANIEKHVVVHEDQRGNKIYSYSKDEYISENLILSYITNGKNFISTSGWKQNSKKLLKTVLFPSFSTNPSSGIERQMLLEYT